MSNGVYLVTSILNVYHFVDIARQQQSTDTQHIPVKYANQHTRWQVCRQYEATTEKVHNIGPRQDVVTCVAFRTLGTLVSCVTCTFAGALQRLCPVQYLSGNHLAQKSRQCHALL